MECNIVLLNYLHSILIPISNVGVFVVQLSAKIFFAQSRVWIKPEPGPTSVGSGFVFQICSGLDRVCIW